MSQLKNKARYKETKIGWIPEAWEVVKLDAICQVKGRIGYRGYTVQDIVPEDEGAITISPSNIRDSNLSFKKCTYISWYKYDESPEIQIKIGDILLVKTGSTFGKSALVTELNKKATINPQLVVIKEVTSDNIYLSYLISSEIIQKQIQSRVVGGAIPTLSQKSILQFEIPSPPLPEQKKIAQILTTWDTAIDKTEQLLQQLQLRKQGLMQQLLSGKKRLRGFEGEWEEVKLSDVANFRNGKGHEKFIDENGKFKVVNSKFISREGKVVKFSNHNICPLFKGEITMVMSDIPNGKAIAKCFLIDKNETYTLNQRICALSAKEEFHNIFILYIINRNHYYLRFDDGVSQTNLRKQQVLDCPLKVPSFKEQVAIATILTQADTEIQKTETYLSQLREQKKGLMQVLLTGQKRVKI